MSQRKTTDALPGEASVSNDGVSVSVSAATCFDFYSTKVFIDTSFFSHITELKLDKLKLSTEPIPIQCEVTMRVGQGMSVSLNDTSFDTGNGGIAGEVINVNTIDEFKKIDKRQLLTEWSTRISNESPSFIGIVMFADLKKYKYYYWVCQPTFQYDFDVKVIDKQPDANEAYVYQGSQFEQLQDKDHYLLYEFNNQSSPKISSNLKNFIYKTKATSSYLAIQSPQGLKKYQITKNTTQTVPPLTGWELNLNGKLGPKSIDLSSLMNPLLLSKQSRDLNLKLMKWRLSPNLPLDVIKSQKCLLLGSGTLGTYIGRLLLAWGVDEITFVDNGKVSYSNPVRQPLFTFDDCLNGGKDKAQAACENLLKVYPNVKCLGVKLEVPMIGHPITSKTSKDFNQLKELIEYHDVIFLLMDSSESRWLPTALARSMNKLVMNTALGYDSFVVMKHGQTKDDGLGCYYCSNINAPGNSSIDKTLDQMCTVTRPGLAPIASGICVELLVDWLQHKENAPQQIRGYLNGFKQNVYHCEKFEHCVGCNEMVLEAVQQWDTLEPLLKEKGLLEKLCGISDLLNDVTLDIDIDEFVVDDLVSDEGEDAEGEKDDNGIN